MSTNYYLRIEPRTTASSLAQGIAARIYDPLWMLGRQWQLGELIGEDAGSPINAKLDAEAALLAVYRPQEAAGDAPYDPRALPLETLVEAAPVRSAKTWTLRLRIDSGREFLRVLDDAGLGGYADGFVAAYEFERVPDDARAADPGAARLLDIVAGRIPDGQKLYADIRDAVRAQTPLPEPPRVAPNDVDPLRKAAQAWLEACGEILFETEQASAWRADSLDYGFSVATSSAARALRLDANEHRGGSLDWHSFDVRPQARPADFQPLARVEGLPAGVSFRGMPNARWWEFEDASVDFGDVDAGASDTARLAMLEFGLVYANDFFAIPLRLAVGSLCRITSLKVVDTFGMELIIGPAARGGGRQGDSRWSMFTLAERDPARAGATGVGDVFFLPPVAPQVIADRPVEEVLLLRDEMANLAWAVERRFEGARGVAEDRVEAELRDRPPAPPPDVNSELRYLLGTIVPAYWFPLVPVNTNGDLRLELQRMVGRPVTVTPRSSFLEGAGASIPDAAVPREGRQLLRDYALTRWSNGASLVWSRRRSRIGRGEGSSGLRFDVAEQT